MEATCYMCGDVLIPGLNVDFCSSECEQEHQDSNPPGILPNDPSRE